MQMKLNVAYAALLAALVTPPAAAAESAPLKPSAPWNVQYAENMCTLVREFGSGEAKLLLVFRPAMFSNQTRMTIIRNASTGAIGDGLAQLTMDSESAIEASYVEGFSKSESISAVAIDIEESKLAALRTAKTFRIQAGKNDVSLAPTAVPAAMRALETCQRNLLVKWGMDSSVVASIEKFPTIPGGILRLFTTNDYPMAAIASNQQGSSGVRFWVSKEGKVSDCKVIESSGSNLLDAQTCAIISKRGLFDSARTKTGEPVASIGFQRVRWVLPS
jgi:TonB family protein